MKVLHNPITLAHRAHEVVGARMIEAYECPERITSILTALEPVYDISHVETDVVRATAAAEKIHSPAYLRHLESIFAAWVAKGMVKSDGCLLPECFPVTRLGPGGHGRAREPKDLAARVGFYAFDMSTGISRDTYPSAIASADLARRGAEELVGAAARVAHGASDAAPVVFSMCRPPGHHCQSDLMGGYCYLNNTAIAVRTLLDSIPSPADQVSILDLDFHHGNGTQSIFYSQSNPCYVSIHGEDEYPYFTGAPEETGEGEGEGYNLNLPLPCEGSTFENYRPRLEEALEKIVSVGTKWLVISLGFDTFVGDPVGKFQLTRQDYGTIGAMVGALKVPTLVVLEGGYVVEELGRNCLSFLRGLEQGRRADAKVCVEVEEVSSSEDEGSSGEESEGWEEVRVVGDEAGR